MLWEGGLFIVLTLRKDTPGVHIDIGVVAIIHLVIHNAFAIGRGVDKYPIPNVNPHMGYRLAGLVFEKDQIPRLKLIPAD